MLKKLLSMTFWRKESGAVSAEFVVIIAFYVFTCTTLFTAVDVFLASNKGYKANAIVTNITSRLNDVTEDDMDDLYALFRNTAAVGTSDSWMRLTAVRNVSGNFEVQWSHSTAGIGDCLADDDKQIDTYIPNVSNGDEVLLLETSIDYSPLFGSTAFGDMTFQQRAVFIPRFVAKMDFQGFVLEEDCIYAPDLDTDPDPGDTLEEDASDPTEEVAENPGEDAL